MILGNRNITLIEASLSILLLREKYRLLTFKLTETATADKGRKNCVGPHTNSTDSQSF